MKGEPETVDGMAEAVESRRNALGLSPGDLAAAAGLTREGMRLVRAGHRRAYNDKTIFGVAAALRWRSDWYDRLRQGLAPEEAAIMDPEVNERFSRIEARIDELARLIREMRSAEGAP